MAKTNLGSLILRINSAYLEATRADQGALRSAHACGLLLNEAKKNIEHGDWLEWLKEKCPGVGVRTAQK